MLSRLHSGNVCTSISSLYCLSTLTWPPSLHPRRHVKTVLYCHDVRAGTVNRTNRMSESFRRQTDSCTARFFCKKLACRNNVCLLTGKQTLCHATCQKYMYFSLQKYFSQKVSYVVVKFFCRGTFPSPLPAHAPHGQGKETSARVEKGGSMLTVNGQPPLRVAQCKSKFDLGKLFMYIS